MKSTSLSILFKALLVFSFFTALPAVQAQVDKTKKPSKYSVENTRENFFNWLAEMKKTLEENYYDRTYGGMDLDQRFAGARARIKSLEFDWQMYRVLVQLLMELNDSHTMIHLPPPSDHFDYGFAMQIVGDECLVVNVKKESDAHAKGLGVGDRVLRIGKYEPTRANLWQIRYVLYRLDPAETVELTVETINGERQKLTVRGKAIPLKEYRETFKKKIERVKKTPVKCSEIGSEVVACKLYSFSVTKSDIDRIFKSAAGRTKLILDLRGNAGGFVDIEEYLVGYFFDRDVKIAEIRTRKKTEARMSKSRGERFFKGELAVLIDSESASASEVFARVIQLEKRGRVIGDLSAGAVMTSIQTILFRSDPYGFSLNTQPLGMSVTVGDVTMSDGNRLEHTGVRPDLPIIPTRLALSKRSDPVLAAAAAFFGAKLTAEEAGTFNFITEKSSDAPVEGISEDPDKP